MTSSQQTGLMTTAAGAAIGYVALRTLPAAILGGVLGAFTLPVVFLAVTAYEVARGRSPVS